MPTAQPMGHATAVAANCHLLPLGMMLFSIKKETRNPAICPEGKVDSCGNQPWSTYKLRCGKSKVRESAPQTAPNASTAGFQGRRNSLIVRQARSVKAVVGAEPSVMVKDNSHGGQA